jgi:hypothetical protein
MGIYGVTQCIAELPFAVLGLLRILTSLTGARSTVAIADEWLVLGASGGGALLVYLFASLAFLLFAPTIAGLFYPSSSLDQPVSLRATDASDLYHLGVVLLGLYVLVQAVPGAVQMFAWLLSSDSLGARPYMARETVSQVISAALYTIVGLVLTLFSRAIAAWSARDE